MLIFSEVLTMKHTFKTLLGLVLVVLFLAGCSNPAGPETPEVNEPPVVETPEVNVKLTKVEFKWSTAYNISNSTRNVRTYIPIYLLGLYYDSELERYFYDFPENYSLESYKSLIKDKDAFDKFYNDTFEEIFGTKYYKEGTVIDLKQWESKAICCIAPEYADCLRFSTKDIYGRKEFDQIDIKNSIEVGNEDMIIYITFNSEDSDF